MPQASAALRDKIVARFGSIDDGPVIRALEEAGYKPTNDFCWRLRPGLTSIDEIPEDEADLLFFLIEEWDYGGVITPEDADVASREATAG